jgi:SpoVK/Ycf46/Vps4 family AAA+-type ATPase
LPEWFIADVAERCEGYCGADLQALCTEAALLAFGRHFPEIYDAEGVFPLSLSPPPPVNQHPPAMKHNAEDIIRKQYH